MGTARNRSAADQHPLLVAQETRFRWIRNAPRRNPAECEATIESILKRNLDNQKSAVENVIIGAPRRRDGAWPTSR